MNITRSGGPQTGIEEVGTLENMRQPVELVGPGVTSEEIAAYFGITPERQAEIRELFRSYHEKNARQNGAKGKRHGKKAASKKSTSRK